MTTQIVIHLLPHEIDWFEWQSKQFKLGSYYINDMVIIDVTLNLNLIDWSKSQLPKQFFIDKFNQIEKLWDWAQTQFIIDEENKCLGCDDKRREAIRSTTADNILYLDSDLIFKPELLSYMIESAKLVEQEYYIISPQTVRMWDSSWDVITNQRYLSTPSNMETYYANDPFEIITHEQIDINLKPINQFKFGGGWFNLFTNSVFKKIPIPIEIGSYGPDDTYISMCAIKKQIPQFILSNIIVSEVGSLHLLDSDYIKPFLSVKINDKEKISDSELFNLIKKFI